MHKVYQHSTLNLSAAGAQDASEGFYFDRDPADIGPHPLCPLSDDKEGQLTNNDCAGASWHLIHEDFVGEILRKTAVFHRAWIFQERQLSKRVLHFGKEQILWECRTATYCETFPDGLPAVLTASTSTLPKSVYEKSRTYSTLLSTIHNRLPGLSDQPPSVQMQMVWQALVIDYSNGKLTYPKDKLVAISGMARDVWSTWHGRIQGRIRYIAGLWDIHLPGTLLWRSTSTQGYCSESYRAPTWSWASIDGSVAWEDRIWSDACGFVTTILDVDIQHLWNEWGEVSSGHILMKGSLCKLQCKEAHPGHLVIGPDEGEDTRYDVAMYRDDWWAFPTNAWDDRLYGLLIVRFQNPSFRRICTLVLCRVAEHQNTFSRVGIAYPMSGSEVGSWFDGCAEQTITLV